MNSKYYEKKLGLINLRITHSDHSSANAMTTHLIIHMPFFCLSSLHPEDAISVPHHTIIPNPPIITKVINILVSICNTVVGALAASLITRHLLLFGCQTNGTSVLR